ncbi:IS1595 family transposase [Akkermansia glycaniphila]|uniref:IS1595 family transposase n=1 Tax=Akkermansia glycaniphila TaxID=1679444 RepID=UPI001C01E425|nr:IS1595 family transposase [Akkermansia glycaniphila]MBT9449514.1 IS1595 family transposase [Akkermansia glycaniphila]
MKNKYVFRSHISERQFRDIIRYFSIDVEASKIALLTGISTNSVSKMLKAVRLRLFKICEQEAHCHESIFECDESYFGARRVRGVRGRGAKGKTIVFGIYDRMRESVYTRVIKQVASKTILKVIKAVVTYSSTIYTDGFRSYIPLKKNGYLHHETVEHGRNEFARNEVHVNGIENFWGIAKINMMKRKGFKGNSFLLHLKECEFRFNHRHSNIYHFLLSLFRKCPLKLY